tara:strand:- start:458 stop:640 length:183 start_codon:yes stop_codon:yes gene_type:complete
MRRGILTQFLISDSVPLNTTGGLAQLGERLAGSQKVSGSSPLSSTTESLADNSCMQRVWL